MPFRSKSQASTKSIKERRFWSVCAWHGNSLEQDNNGNAATCHDPIFKIIGEATVDDPADEGCPIVISMPQEIANARQNEVCYITLYAGRCGHLRFIFKLKCNYDSHDPTPLPGRSSQPIPL